MLKKNIDFSAIQVFNYPRKDEVQKNVLELRVAPIEKVRVAFIGIGNRGIKAVDRYTYLTGVEIKIFCDLNSENIRKAQNIISQKGYPQADEYSELNDWQEVCKRNDIDLVYISTQWRTHAQIAIYAMEHGKHVAVEVPAAVTVEEAWQIVDTAERTQRHCMGLENCIYDSFQMAAYNMAENGLLGEITHVEGGYIHDLRSRSFVEGESMASGWEINELKNRNGNLYPTHGLGPLCHLLNIHRGDKMNYLVSLSSKQMGLTEFAKKTTDFKSSDFVLGDMNTTLIRTAKGKSIMLQQNIANPRPYSRLFSVTGTKGFLQKYPFEIIALAPDADEYYASEKKDKLVKKYMHSIIKELGEKSKSIGDHDGIDFIMDYRLIYCLHNGLPLDQDVYDAAEWASIAELSEISVANHSCPVEIPDFTRGAWQRLNKVNYYQ